MPADGVTPEELLRDSPETRVLHQRGDERRRRPVHPGPVTGCRIEWRMRVRRLDAPQTFVPDPLRFRSMQYLWKNEEAERFEVQALSTGEIQLNAPSNC